MKQVAWTTIKSLATAKSISLQYIDEPTQYTLYLNDNGFTVYCPLDKSPTDTTELDDFVNNYKAAANAPMNQLDTDGAFIVRNKAAKKGWTFCSLPFEFETARRSDSLYSKDSLGNDRTFITLKLYDNSNNEITTDGLLGANLATAVKTVIDFEPPYDYEIIGGDMRTLTTISTDIRLWLIAVPDIPANMGGSKEMGGGVNLRYLAPGNVFSVDGRVTKYATYSASYHTNKIRLILKYPAGTNESLSIVIQLYKL